MGLIEYVFLKHGDMKYTKHSLQARWQAQLMDHVSLMTQNIKGSNKSRAKPSFGTSSHPSWVKLGSKYGHPI